MGKATALSRLIPKATEVKIGDATITIAGDAEENKILNYIMAAKIRALMDFSLQKFRDGEQVLTPRELKEIADAGRVLAEYSALIYKEEPIHNKPSEVNATPQGVEVPDFSKLSEPEEERPAENPL